MRAVQVLQPTGPADVRVVDVPEPEPGPGDVVVEVHSVGVSFPDLLLSQGRYQLRPEPPFTLGVDVAGTVGRINREVVAIFEKWGFTWGGIWHYTDPMHFELNRIIHPG